MKTEDERTQRFKEKYHLDRPFWKGWASILHPFDDLDFLKISNEEALRSDWENVYEDLREATTKVLDNEFPRR